MNRIVSKNEIRELKLKIITGWNKFQRRYDSIPSVFQSIILFKPFVGHLSYKTWKILTYLFTSFTWKVLIFPVRIMFWARFCRKSFQIYLRSYTLSEPHVGNLWTIKSNIKIFWCEILTFLGILSGILNFWLKSWIYSLRF